MSDYLPEALVLEILYGLPLKTLVRCTSVCKAWNTTIKSHTFITSHLQKNLSNLLIGYIPPFNDEEKYSLYSLGPNGLHTIAKLHYSFLTPSGWSSWRVRFVATVNGVLCLSNDLLKYPDFIILWNPFIQKHIELPASIFPVPTSRNSCTCFLGFGFDSQKKDFKVARVCYHGRGVVPPFVELYSLNEHTWRIIDASCVDVRIAEHVGKQCFLNGNVHWLAYEGTQVPFKICVLIFNVQEENFKKLTLPPELSSLRSYQLTISVIKGCFSIVDYVHEQTTSVCNIWMQRESDSWNKMHRINLKSGIQKVLPSWISDEIFTVSCGQIASLDLFEAKGQRTTNLGIQGIATSFFVSEYKHSLALIDKKHDAEGRIYKSCVEWVQDEEL